MTTWDTNWEKPSIDPRDALSQDDVLMSWDTAKKTLAKAKELEMEWRKYVVKRAFPNPTEGINTLELGAGYELKASIKFNYKLKDNDVVEAGLDRISQIGNRGAFIADRLVSWTPNFLLSEYRELQTLAGTSAEAKAILKEVEQFLVIDEAAPTLSIKEPKAKK